MIALSLQLESYFLEISSKIQFYMYLSTICSRLHYLYQLRYSCFPLASNAVMSAGFIERVSGLYENGMRSELNGALPTFFEAKIEFVPYRKRHLEFTTAYTP